MKVQRVIDEKKLCTRINKWGLKLQRLFVLLLCGCWNI